MNVGPSRRRRTLEEHIIHTHAIPHTQAAQQPELLPYATHACPPRREHCMHASITARANTRLHARTRPTPSPLARPPVVPSACSSLLGAAIPKRHASGPAARQARHQTRATCGCANTTPTHESRREIVRRGLCSGPRVATRRHWLMGGYRSLVPLMALEDESFFEHFVEQLVRQHHVIRLRERFAQSRRLHTRSSTARPASARGHAACLLPRVLRAHTPGVPTPHELEWSSMMAAACTALRWPGSQSPQASTTSTQAERIRVLRG